MAYRFKASKYKNAAPKVPKKEGWITDISIGSPQSHGNHIKASAAYMAFNAEARGGGSLGVLPIDAAGKCGREVKYIHCHAELVTDFEFSPFHDGLVATGSQDTFVKLWTLPKGGLTENICNPVDALPAHPRRVENVLFHPSADNVLATSSGIVLTLWDLNKMNSLWSFNDHAGQIMSTSWRDDGSVIATFAKDKFLRIFEPRASTFASEIQCHSNVKDGRVAWMGSSGRILTCGFDSGHQRQVTVRDLRNLSQPIKSIALDTSPGVLIPLFDPDTNMLFMVGKGDSSILFLEYTDNEPIISEASRHVSEQPVKGICMVPKRAMRVMECEVNRLLQLTTNAIIPIPYHVPRKSYRDFHADLFPDTRGAVPAMTAGQWWGGENHRVTRISLNPGKLGTRTLLRFGEDDNEYLGGGDPGITDSTNLQNGGSHTGRNKPTSDPKKPASAGAYSSAAEYTPGGAVIVTARSPSAPVPPYHPFSSGSHPAATALSLSSSNQTGNGDRVAFTSGDLPISGESSRHSSISSVSSGGTPVPAPRSRRRPSLSMPADAEAFSRAMSVDASGPPVAAPRASTRKSSRDETSYLHTRAYTISCDEPHQNGHSDHNNAVHPAPAANPASPAMSRANTARTNRFVPGLRQSKFRHLKGDPLKNQQIDNLRDLGTSLPGECDGFHGNPERVAVPLQGPGGKLAIFELNRTGRLPDGVRPALINGATVLDFLWDPFDNHRIAVAVEGGKINVWQIPNGGLTDSVNTPDFTLACVTEKLSVLKFHPLARDILASAAHDYSGNWDTVRIWDLITKKTTIELQGHTDQIFSMAWSPDGQYLASVCRDNKLRVYNPRYFEHPQQEGAGPVGNRGARIMWTLDGQFLLVTGFDRSSQRELYVYSSEHLDTPISSVSIDVAPAILIPYYDEDSSTVFVTGKGESTVFAYEVSPDAPHLHPLSHHKCPGPHQALTLLPKNVCNVREVEFARVLRLTKTTIESIAFKVPRVKTELFQDDLFPDTKVTWTPSMSSREWLNGTNRPVKRMSLRPQGMGLWSENNMNKTVSSAPVPAAPGGANHPVENRTHESPSSKKYGARTERLKVLFNTLSVEDGILTQDTMEGVDASEWNE